MARPLRIEYDGALYHVTSRGNERKSIFKDATDRETFLSILSQVRIPTQIGTQSAGKTTLVPIEIGTGSEANRHPSLG